MEKREKTPPLEKVILIAERLGTTPEYILRGEQKEKPALQMENGLKEIDAIFEQLTPSRQAKLLELARLYLDDQRRNEET